VSGHVERVGEGVFFPKAVPRKAAFLDIVGVIKAHGLDPSDGIPDGGPLRLFDKLA